MASQDLQRKVADFTSKVQMVLNEDQTVEEAMSTIRQFRVEEKKIFYFYVVDSEDHLKGVVSTRNLLLSQPDTKIHSIMEDDLICVFEHQTLEEVMEILSSHRLLAVPVIDKERRLKGIIDIQLYLEEAIDLAKNRRSSTDVFQVLGITLEEGKTHSSWKIYQTRMPWIFCNMIGGTACAIISRVFEVVLGQVLLLAFFIPLVLTLSESISMQSMSYSLQLLHRPRLSGKRIFLRIISDWKIVMWLAISSGLIVGAISLFWGNGIHPAMSIAMGIIISVTISGAIGAAIPLILHAKKLDPKVAAGPVVLTLADIITTTIYLSLATAWLL